MCAAGYTGLRCESGASNRVLSLEGIVKNVSYRAGLTVEQFFAERRTELSFDAKLTKMVQNFVHCSSVSGKDLLACLKHYFQVVILQT